MINKVIRATKITDLNDLFKRKRNNTDDFIFESLYRGYRVLAYIKKDEVIFEAANGEKFTKKFTKIEKSLLDLKINDAIVDGVICTLNEELLTDLESLQLYKSSKKNAYIRFCALDLIKFKGKDLMHLAVTERKKILEDHINLELIEKDDSLILNKNVLFIPEKHDYNKDLKSRMVSRKRYGFSCKNKDSKYEPLKEDIWFNVLSNDYRNYIICGYTRIKNEDKDVVKSLALGEYKDNKLIFKGHSKVIENEELALDLYKRLKKIHKLHSPYSNDSEIKDSDVIFVKPTLVASFLVEEVSQSSNVKLATFLGLRLDKDAKEVISKKPVTNPLQLKRLKKNDTIASVRLTALDKIVYPRLNISKRQIVDYYSLINDRLLKYSNQSNVYCHTMVNFEKIDVEFSRKLNSLSNLLRAIEKGATEFRQNISKKDYIIFNIFGVILRQNQVREATKIYFNTLKENNIKAYLKTNGENGYDIIVSTKNNKIKNTEEFIEDINIKVKKKKESKNVLDKVEVKTDNKNFILPYSLNANINATISCPIYIDEIDSVKADSITMENIVEKLLKENNPWE